MSKSKQVQAAVQAPAQAPAQAAAPAAVQAPAPAAAKVPLKGAAKVEHSTLHPSKVATGGYKLAGKPYRTGAVHNQAWWAALTAAVQAGGGTATAQALQEAKVPGDFVGYVVRRGYVSKV